MRKNWLALLLVVIIGISSVGSAATTVDKKMRGELTIWSWISEPKTLHIPAFKKLYPNVKINFSVWGVDEYQLKTKMVLTSGIGAPDLLYQDIKFYPNYVNSQYVESLDSYGAKKLSENWYTYLRKASYDKKGEIKGIPWQATPGGLWYRREVAKKYLGTDDPDKISEMTKGWDNFIALGEKLNKSSGGSMALIGSLYDLANIYFGAIDKPWFANDKFMLNKEVEEFLDLCKQFREKNCEARTSGSTADWDARKTGTKYIFSPAPLWFSSQLQVNAPETVGLWGVADPPVVYYYGGSYCMMYSKCKNKALAWKYLEFLGSDEFQYQYCKSVGDFPANMSTAQTLIKNKIVNKTAAGQDLYRAYDKLAKSIDASPWYPKQFDILNCAINAGFSYASGKKSKDAAIKIFKMGGKNILPDVTF